MKVSDWGPAHGTSWRTTVPRPWALRHGTRAHELSRRSLPVSTEIRRATENAGCRRRKRPRGPEVPLMMRGPVRGLVVVGLDRDPLSTVRMFEFARHDHRPRAIAAPGNPTTPFQPPPLHRPVPCRAAMRGLGCRVDLVHRRRGNPFRGGDGRSWARPLGRAILIAETGGRTPKCGRFLPSCGHRAARGRGRGRGGRRERTSIVFVDEDHGHGRKGEHRQRRLRR